MQILLEAAVNTDTWTSSIQQRDHLDPTGVQTETSSLMLPNLIDPINHATTV